MQRKVHFAYSKDVIIVSEVILERLLNFIKTSKTYTLNICADELIDNDYITYILKVLNSNRSQDGFEFEYLNEGTILKKDIHTIICKQLLELKFNKEKCFLEIGIVNIKEDSVYFNVKCKKAFLEEIKQNKPLCYTDPKGNRFEFD